MGPDESARLVGLLREVRATAEHHYDKMVEGARIFLWAFTLVIGSSFALIVAPIDKTPLVDVAAIGVLWMAWVVAGLGRRVVIQQRQLFEYDNQVRLAIERALGLDRRIPKIHNVTKWALIWPAVRSGDREPSVHYANPASNSEALIQLSDTDIDRIVHIRRIVRRKGMFGALLLIFNLALVSVVIMSPVYAWWVVRAHPDLTNAVPETIRQTIYRAIQQPTATPSPTAQPTSTQTAAAATQTRTAVAVTPTSTQTIAPSLGPATVGQGNPNGEALEQGHENRPERVLPQAETNDGH